MSSRPRRHVFLPSATNTSLHRPLHVIVSEVSAGRYASLSRSKGEQPEREKTSNGGQASTKDRRYTYRLSQAFQVAIVSFGALMASLTASSDHEINGLTQSSRDNLSLSAGLIEQEHTEPCKQTSTTVVVRHASSKHACIEWFNSDLRIVKSHSLIHESPIWRPGAAC